MSVLASLVQLLLLVLHLVCVNVATGGPMIALWLEIREGRGDPLAGRIGRRLTGYTITALLLGALIGLLYGWTIWTDEFSNTLSRLGTRILYGITEFLFSVVLLGIVWIWWRARPDCGWLQRICRLSILFLAASNVFYHFPFLFQVIVWLQGQAETTAVDSTTFRALLIEGEILWRTIHFWMASFAVSGIVVAWIAYQFVKDELAEADVYRVTRWGGWIALVSSLIQLPTGVMITLHLSPTLQYDLMGEDVMSSVLFWGAAGLAVILFHVLAAIALGKSSRQRIYSASLLMLVVIAVMVTVSQRLRTDSDMAIKKPDAVASGYLVD